MGTALIKANKADDVYVLWSSGEEGPIGVMSAKDAKKWYVKQAKEEAERAFKKTLERADEHGSSSIYRPFDVGTWNNEEIMTRIVGSRPCHFGYIKRSDLAEFTEVYAAGNWWAANPKLDRFVRPGETED